MLKMCGVVLGHANIETTNVYSHIGVDEDEAPKDVFADL
jgi:site-specific recombinase XerD